MVATQAQGPLPTWVNPNNPQNLPFDPGAAQLGFFQPRFKSQYGYLATDAPNRIGAYQREALPLIHEATRGAYLEQAETLGEQQGAAQRKAADEFGVMGLSPAAYHGTIQPQQNQQFASALAALRGGAVQQEAQGQLDLGGQILNALNQLEAYYDSLNLSFNLAAKSRAAERKAGKAANLTTLGSALIGGGASMGSAALMPA